MALQWMDGKMGVLYVVDEQAIVPSIVPAGGRLAKASACPLEPSGDGAQQPIESAGRRLSQP